MNGRHPHEISDHPEVAWALKLLQPDPTYEHSVLSKYAAEICCIGFGFAGACVTNFVNRRPIYSGAQKHVIAMIGGYAIAKVINKYVDEYHAERDTRMRDYIVRHPELFPEPERKKFSEILSPWPVVR